MISNIQKLVLIFLSIVVFPVYSIEMPTFNGYLGYRYVWSSIKTEIMPLNSKPELGLIGSWEPTDNWGVYGQLAYEEQDSFENMLVYGFVEYSNSIFHIPFRFQVGKLQDSLGLYNASRINPRTRPGGTIAPQSVYWSGLNLLLTSGYGFRSEFDIGEFTFGYSMTQPIINTAEFNTFTFFQPLPDSPNVDFTDKKVLTLAYNPINSRWRSKLTFTDVSLSDIVKDIQWVTASTEYESQNWSLTLEGGMVKLVGVEWSDGTSNLGYGGSLFGNYSLNQYVTLRSGYSVYYAPETLLGQVQPFVGFDDSTKYHHDLWIGTTLNYNNWDLMFDVHKVYGGNFIRPSDWNKQTDYKDWWYFGTSLTYHF